MDTGFLHKAAELVRHWAGQRSDAEAVTVPVRTRTADEADEHPGAAPVEPLFPDQSDAIARLLDERLESMARGEVYSVDGAEPESLGNALNLDAGLVLIALDETLGGAGEEQLSEIMDEWAEQRAEALPEEELADFLHMADEYRQAWREFPGDDPFPFILAIGATDSFMLAENEQAEPDPETVAKVARNLFDDAAGFYGEVVRILNER
jgi:hypothetical protein